MKENIAYIVLIFMLSLTFWFLISIVKTETIIYEPNTIIYEDTYRIYEPNTMLLIQDCELHKPIILKNLDCLIIDQSVIVSHKGPCVYVGNDLQMVEICATSLSVFDPNSCIFEYK